MQRQFTLIAAITLFAGPASAADYVAMSGKDLYLRFCASCHGDSGGGDITRLTDDLWMLQRSAPR